MHTTRMRMHRHRRRNHGNEYSYCHQSPFTASPRWTRSTCGMCMCMCMCTCSESPAPPVSSAAQPVATSPDTMVRAPQHPQLAASQHTHTHTHTTHWTRLITAAGCTITSIEYTPTATIQATYEATWDAWKQQGVEGQEVLLVHGTR